MLRVADETCLGGPWHRICNLTGPLALGSGIFATNSPRYYGSIRYRLLQKIEEGPLLNYRRCHASVTFSSVSCQALASGLERSHWSVHSYTRVSDFRLNFRIGGILQCKSPRARSVVLPGCSGCRIMALDPRSSSRLDASVRSELPSLRPLQPLISTAKCRADLWQSAACAHGYLRYRVSPHLWTDEEEAIAAALLAHSPDILPFTRRTAHGVRTW